MKHLKTIVILLFSLAPWLPAETKEPIRYTVRFPAPQTHYLEVEVSIPAEDPDVVRRMQITLSGPFGRVGGVREQPGSRDHGMPCRFPVLQPSADYCPDSTQVYRRQFFGEVIQRNLRVP